MTLTYRNITTLDSEQQEKVYREIYLHGYQMWGEIQPTTLEGFTNKFVKDTDWNPALVATDEQGNLVALIDVLINSILSHHVEFGYMVNPKYRNRGVATQMIGYFMDYLNKTYGACHFSASVLETEMGEYSSKALTKNGFNLIATVPSSSCRQGEIVGKRLFYKEYKPKQ